MIAAALATVTVYSAVAHAQTTAPPAPATTPQKPGLMSGGIPDLSGIWNPDFSGPEGVRINSWDSSDPFARHPEQAPMTPWAA